MDKPTRPRRGRNTPAKADQPRPSSPRPPPSRCWCGGDDGDEVTECLGASLCEGHHQHHQHTALAAHLKSFYNHNWANRLIAVYGIETVLLTLDAVTERYGLHLDAEKPTRRRPDSYYGHREDPEYEIANPAAFLTWQVRKTHEEKQAADARQLLEQEQAALERRKRFRVVGDEQHG